MDATSDTTTLDVDRLAEMLGVTVGELGRKFAQWAREDLEQAASKVEEDRFLSMDGSGIVRDWPVDLIARAATYWKIARACELTLAARRGGMHAVEDPES